MSTPSIAQAIARDLIDLELDVFGVVGNGNIHVVAEFEALGGTYTSLRHEEGALAAADAYYRATGRIACATTTYGPGFTNTITSLAEAHAARIPMLYLASDIPTTGPRPIDVNQRGVVEALGVTYLEVRRDNAVGMMRAALVLARRLSAPVVVALPFDLCGPTPISSDVQPSFIVDEPTLPDASHRVVGEPLSPRAGSALVEVARELAAAKRPLIIAGRGVVESGTAALVRELAEILGALTATSVMAREILDPQFNLGVAGGFANHGRLPLFREADVVLILGASMNRLQMRGGTLFAREARILRVDAGPSNPAFLHVDSYIHADLGVAVPHLLELATAEHPAAQWRAEVGELPAPENEQADPGCFDETGSDGRLDPRHVLRRLDDLLPDNRSVVTDGGHFLGWVPKYLSVPDERATVIVGAAVMTIGLGLSSATGVSAGRPDRYTALISGDGGTLMALADLESFLRVTRSGCLVVLNDSAYGAEVHQYASKGVPETTMLIDDVDFARLGTAFGVPGLTVTKASQLAPGGEVERFLAGESRDYAGPRILDVKISREPVADFLKEL